MRAEGNVGNLSCKPDFCLKVQFLNFRRRCKIQSQIPIAMPLGLFSCACA